LRFALIIISTVLTILIMLQAKGGGVNAMMGGEGGIYRTRRGLERSLFNFTIVLAGLYLLISFLTVIIR
jgi:preprotein translocase subunit SecG